MKSNRGMIVVLALAAFFVAWRLLRTDLLSDAQKQLIALNAQLETDYASYWKQFNSATGEQRMVLAREKDPIRNAATGLFEFERSNRGTAEGLMALRIIISNAARGGPIDGPRDLARRRAVDLLHAYVGHPEIVDTVSYLNHGNPDNRHQQVISDLIVTAGPSTLIGLHLRIALCSMAITNRTQYRWMSERISELGNGSQEEFPEECRGLNAVIALLPGPDDLEKDYHNAIADLRAISASEGDLKAISCQPIGGSYCIVKLNESQDATAATVADLASGILFRESLANGDAGRTLTVTLLDGQQWSSSDYAGQYIVVQFSTIPCAPCEKMYIELDRLHESGEFECLTIFQSTPEESQAKQRKSRLDWSVASISDNDPLLALFGVNTFPTALLVSPEGKFQALGHSIDATQLLQNLKTSRDKAN